jgi:hypothetical protein
MTTSDFGKDLELVELMANNILAMEDKYEASMRGGFLKRLMNEYVRLHAERVYNIFDFIYTKQLDDCVDYGDSDITVKKILVKNDLVGRGKKSEIADKFDYSCRAIVVTDNCGFGGSKVMCEVIRTHKIHTGIIDKYYHIRCVKSSEIEVVSLSKMQDVKEETYVISYVYDILGSWRIERDIDMVDFYVKFKMFLDIIRDIYYQINNPNSDGE